MASVSVTITVPQELLDAADTIARQRKTSRSSVITEMLAKQLRTIETEQMALAYQDWSEENQALAESARGYASEQMNKLEYDA